MSKTILKKTIAAVITAMVFFPVSPSVAGTPQAANAGKAAAKTVNARPEGVNLDMIYMPSKGNKICTADQGQRDSCMVDVVVTYADGVTRKEFGVYVGRDLIVTNYELVTGHGDTHAVKPGDGHAYTVALGDGTTRKALPWAFVPGSVAVLRMQ
ncbi:hypothetical protein [Rivihabitans pingtungensis]|uniref:Secreted protein n=1 Tax=Rivihabitans pingtungensis TaxID=1054498 RepID=A0A318KC61_9NEIS|nr:hypothetical protein [Rivihabitans pingtungensis]PXX73681.1 hypothetical protein DFR34_13911 [Rivihabitans pingtungensis]